MFPFFRFQFRRTLPLMALAGISLGMMACHKHERHAFCHSCEKPNSMAEKAFKHFSRQLDLNASQKIEVESLFKSTFEDACKLKSHHDNLIAAFLKDLRSDSEQHEDFTGAMNQSVTAMDTLKTLLLERYARLHAILTPDQRKKLANLIEKHS